MLQDAFAAGERRLAVNRFRGEKLIYGRHFLMLWVWVINGRRFVLSVIGASLMGAIVSVLGFFFVFD